MAFTYYGLSEVNPTLGALTLTVRRVAAQVNAVLKLTTSSDDDAGRRIATDDPLNRIPTTVHDAAGHVVESIDPLDQITTFSYGAAGRLTRSVTPMWRRRRPAVEEPPPAAEVTANAQANAPEVRVKAFRIGFVGAIGVLLALLLGGIVGQLGTVILYVALEMIYRGGVEIMAFAGS